MFDYEQEITDNRVGRINRTELATALDTIDEAIATSAQAEKTLSVCLILLQVRNLGRVNLSSGYHAGDIAVASLGLRLFGALGDRSRVMRVGAGKFAIVLFELKTSSHAMLAAKKVERLAADPIEIDGEELRIDIAQGMALHPDNAVTSEQLFQRAEIALKEAHKRENFFAAYSTDLSNSIEHSSGIESSVLDALSEGAIEPFFQPQIDLNSGEICGAEALLRCRDASGSLLDPETVVEVAERTGNLLQLTSTMLNVAQRHAADWPKQPHPHRLAVNVSAKSLLEPDLLESIASSLNIWGTDPDSLTIEITENALMTNPEQSFDLLRRIRELGARVAIDDFGTGYSSYSYFKDIPANELKIDKAFVLNLINDPTDQKIVRSVIALAHSFDLEVVAEGAEDQATVDLLRQMGCDTAQGYWVGKPLSANDYLTALKSSPKNRD